MTTDATGILDRTNEVTPPRTLLDVLRDTTRRHPDASALEDAAGALSYRELMARVVEPPLACTRRESAAATASACACPRALASCTSRSWGRWPPVRPTCLSTPTTPKSARSSYSARPPCAASSRVAASSARAPGSRMSHRPSCSTVNRLTRAPTRRLSRHRPSSTTTRGSSPTMRRRGLRCSRVSWSCSAAAPGVAVGAGRTARRRALSPASGARRFRVRLGPRAGPAGEWGGGALHASLRWRRAPWRARPGG